MLVYVYDGTFEGLLTSIYDAYYREKKPEEIVKEHEFIQTLINIPLFIVTDTEKSGKVYSAIKKKISEQALEYIYYCFISDMEGASTLIYKYIKLGFKLGNKVDLHLHIDEVLKIHNIHKKVTYEIQRMLGFIRFKSVNNKFYYAAMEPDHNIASIIAPHFADRMSVENWVIHDLKREIAIFYNSKEWIVASLPKEKYSDFQLHKDDEFYELLWKTFFHSVAIGNRKNLRLQRSHMPVRYWKHLIETKN